MEVVLSMCCLLRLLSKRRNVLAIGIATLFLIANVGCAKKSGRCFVDFQVVSTNAGLPILEVTVENDSGKPIHLVRYNQAFPGCLKLSLDGYAYSLMEAEELRIITETSAVRDTICLSDGQKMKYYVEMFRYVDRYDNHQPSAWMQKFILAKRIDVVAVCEGLQIPQVSSRLRIYNSVWANSASP